MQSTLDLFRRFSEDIPPFVPEEIQQKMQAALRHVASDPTITVEDIEKIMTSFAYELWSYHQAYREFFVVFENKLAETFFTAKLSPPLADRYDNFKRYGGTLRDIHSGRPAAFFTNDERVALGAALVQLKTELNHYVRSQIVGLEEKKYRARVREFQAVLAEIKQLLEVLRHLADEEDEHPALAAEIRARIRYFEQGLSPLGSAADHQAVRESIDFFRGRRQELDRLRGIHKTITIDWSEAN